MARGDKHTVLADLHGYVQKHGNPLAFPTDASVWAVLSPIEQAIKAKVMQYGVPLKDLGVTIKFGIKTGKDSAFIVDEETKASLIAQDPKSAEIIRPILRGRDIQRYGYVFADKWIIATFPALNLDIDDYPAIRDYLLTFDKRVLAQTGEKNIDGIKGKNARKQTGNKWFETQDQIGYWSLFSRPHLVWKRIGSGIRFAYCDSEMFSLDSTCIMTGDQLKYICAILNSKIGHYLFREAPTTGTGDLLLSVQALMPIRIPYATEAILKSVEDFYASRISEETLLDKIATLYHFTEDELAYIKAWNY